jgi:hypothetical protein
MKLKPHNKPAATAATADTEKKTEASQATSPTPKDEYLICPSFDDEPWKSRAAALRPKSLGAYTINLTDTSKLPPPLPNSHPYVQLILEYLDSLPDECWIDEENDVD